MSDLNYLEGQKIIWNFMNHHRTIIFGEDGSILFYLIHLFKHGFLKSFRPSDSITNFLKNLFDENSNRFPEYELKLYQVFRTSLQTLSSSDIEFYSFFKNLSRLDEKWFDDYSSRLFDDLLKSFSSSFSPSKSKEIGWYRQTQKLTKFVVKLSGYDGKGSLYNPFASDASYCVELAGNGDYIAQEANPITWAIGTLRLMANKKNPTSFLCEDSVRQWRGSSNENFADKEYDCIISTPPFGLKLNDCLLNNSKYRTTEEFFIWNSVSSLSLSGVAIGVFPSSLLWRSGKSFDLRNFLIDFGLLDTVITLPAGVFSNSFLLTAIMKFSIKNYIQDTVTIVNGTSFFKKEVGSVNILFDDLLAVISERNQDYVKVVSRKEIRKNNYDLTPSLYFEENESVPDGFHRVRLSDVAEIVKGNRCTTSSTLWGKVVKNSSLSKSPFNYTLDINTLPNDVVKGYYRKITTPVILVSLFQPLRPTYVYASETEPIFITQNILALKIKDDSLYFPCLILLLSRMKVFEEGVIIPSIKVSTFLNRTILLPGGYSSQEAFFRNAEAEYKQSKIRELDLEEMLVSREREYKLVVRNRKHDINTYVGDIRNRIQGLNKFLRKHGIDKQLYSPSQNKTVGDNLNAIINSLDKMGHYLDHITDDDVYGTPSKIDLCEELKEIKGGNNYDVNLVFDKDVLSMMSEDISEEHAYINIAKSDLEHVFLNIISNARVHGFVDPSFTDYRIEIFLSYDKRSDNYVIKFRNNGKPFPEGMDTSRYGTDGAKAGPTQGDGHGGAIVKNIVEHYGGSVEIVSSPDAFYTVCVIIYFPRCYGD